MRELWSTCEAFDEETRKTAREMDEREAESAFAGELAFGTGGLRGLIGVGTNRMNLYTVARATQGLAETLPAGARVAVSCDSRRFSAHFARVTAGVLAQNGITCYLYSRLMPTPLLSYAVRALHADAGVMITASHNPAVYNGYKVYGADGCQITQQAALRITERIEHVRYESLRWMDEAQARACGFLRDVPDEVTDAYYRDTCALRTENQSISLRVVYTPLHGAGLEPVLGISRRMGFAPIVVSAQREPDGRFPTCEKPNPEYRAALQPGLEVMARENADLLIATDPDSDRVGVAARGADGEIRVLSGNEVGLLLLDDLLTQREKAGTRMDGALAVKTIVTSDLAFSVARAHGAQVLEVLTGFKYIGETIGRLESEGRANQYVFGFEESCGYLAGTHVRDKDGVQAFMLVVDMAQRHLNAGVTLPEAMDALYARHGFMAVAQMDFAIDSPRPMDDMQLRMQQIRRCPPQTLCGFPVSHTLDYLPGLNGLPPENVLSLICGDDVKLIIRPSGTEPKIKAYLFVRDADRARAGRTLSALKDEAQRLLGPGATV